MVLLCYCVVVLLCCVVIVLLCCVVVVVLLCCVTVLCYCVVVLLCYCVANCLKLNMNKAKVVTFSNKTNDSCYVDNAYRSTNDRIL